MKSFIIKMVSVATFADALQKCQRGSGSKCEVWHRFSNMCLGMATGMKNGKLPHFVGITPNERMANDVGLVLMGIMATKSVLRNLPSFHNKNVFRKPIYV